MGKLIHAVESSSLCLETTQTRWYDFLCSWPLILQCNTEREKERERERERERGEREREREPGTRWPLTGVSQALSARNSKKSEKVWRVWKKSWKGPEKAFSRLFWTLRGSRGQRPQETCFRLFRGFRPGGRGRLLQMVNGFWEREREREGARQRETWCERERDTQKQRQTETDRDRQGQTETDRDRQRQTDRERESVCARWTKPLNFQVYQLTTQSVSLSSKFAMIIMIWALLDAFLAHIIDHGSLTGQLVAAPSLDAHRAVAEGDSVEEAWSVSCILRSSSDGRPTYRGADCWVQGPQSQVGVRQLSSYVQCKQCCCMSHVTGQI